MATPIATSRSRTKPTAASAPVSTDEQFMRLALRLARKGLGRTSPNPAVGALFVRNNTILGQGWHRRAGQPHAEIEALNDAQRRGSNLTGATLYVTLEPCSTHGRTPPCTEAITALPLHRVVVGATDPHPQHRGKAFRQLRKAGLQVTTGVLADEATALNAAFNHWIVHRRPLVTVKAAMTLDGKIATAKGESKWITGPKARTEGMRLRRAADAILVGINTILSDDPSLTCRNAAGRILKPLRRVILDTRARTPLNATVLTDSEVAHTWIVVGPEATESKIRKLQQRAKVIRAPLTRGRIRLKWLLDRLGKEAITHLLIEGGGEVNASFLLSGLAQRIAFFYAPMILGGADARKAVAGDGARRWNEMIRLVHPTWKRVGDDWMLTASVLV